MRPSLLLVSLLCPACAAAEPIDPAAGAGGAGDVSAPEGEAAVCTADEEVGEARDPWTWNGVCQAACLALGSMGCTAAVLACAEATTVSAGALLIPCVVALPLACVGAVECVDLCWSLLPLSSDEALHG